MTTTTLAPAPAATDEPGRAPHRFELVAVARDDVRFREGVLAALRTLGRFDLVTGLVEDIEWLDRFSPDEPPSLTAYSALGSIRRAPDGTLLDLVRPIADRDGRRWHWSGFTTTGEPMLTPAPGSGLHTPISEVYDRCGPFTQDPALPQAAGPCHLCGTELHTDLFLDGRSLRSFCAWCRPEARRAAGSGVAR